jgi:hypothetical protein
MNKSLIMIFIGIALIIAGFYITGNNFNGNSLGLLYSGIAMMSIGGLLVLATLGKWLKSYTG